MEEEEEEEGRWLGMSHAKPGDKTNKQSLFPGRRLGLTIAVATSRLTLEIPAMTGAIRACKTR